MISKSQAEHIAFHGTVHKMGMCSCPCFEALIQVGERLYEENKLRLHLAHTNPHLLAALIIGAASADDGDNDGGMGNRESNQRHDHRGEAEED
jgi:hypothetical protein